MKFNPFDKELSKITENDLQTLIDREIGEGWYVEYKSSIPLKNEKINNERDPKSIASFANTKGGWIFWGITCDKKNNPVSIDGIDIEKFKNFDDQLSQTINSNINPNPYYDLKKVSLINGKIVLIIKIDESPTPPYITSKGIIYQRENNESKPIKDRYIIEKLNEKSNRYHESIENFCKFELGETKGQADGNHTFVELYLFPLPFNSYYFDKYYTPAFFREVAASFYQDVNIEINGTDINVPINIGFNSVYSSENSLIIRNLNNRNLIYKTTTVELFRNGSLKLTLPLYEFSIDNTPEQYKYSKTIEYLLKKYHPDYSNLNDENNDSLIMNDYIKNDDFINHVELIDGADLILKVLLIFSKYKSVLANNDFDFKMKIGVRAKITDSWRKFIFFDNDDYLEKIKQYNIPLSPKNSIEIPNFVKGNYFVTGFDDDNTALYIAKNIIEGIGLPNFTDIKYIDILSKRLNHLKKSTNTK